MAPMGEMIFDGFAHQLPDIDPERDEVSGLDSFDQVVETEGKNRARFLLMKLQERARELQVGFPATVSTPYINTIPPDLEPWFPGDEHIERRIRAYIRWNAAVMVTRANTLSEGIGGHLSTYASSASLYEVGFNHFFRGKDDGSFGDQIYYQGHAAPGIYAARLPRGTLHRGPARPLPHGGGRRRACRATPTRGSCRTSGSSPPCRWASAPSTPSTRPASTATCSTAASPTPAAPRCGASWATASPTSPRACGALSLGAREQLDNLIFVVNCNLQRLDGPVRGNGKIIQELEAVFRGAGWNVDQGHLGQQVGRAARPGHRRRAAQQDEHHRRRRVPEVHRRVGRLHPGTLLRPRPPPAQAGRAPLATRSCSSSPAADTTTASSTPRTRPPSSTRARPPPSSPRR